MGTTAPTPYQRHAMTVACSYCGAAVGVPCTPPDRPVPPDAARVHISRVIAADAEAMQQTTTTPAPGRATEE